MIKFFRKIRQNLLNEGKTTKYFKYAIGEIVLVVIGILIALSINTWNENRKNKNEASFQLSKLKDNLNADKAQIKMVIDEDSTYINNLIFCGRVLSKEVNATKEEFTDRFQDIYNTINFNPVRGTFDGLISSGKIELISNQELLDALFSYYNSNSYKAWDSAMTDYSRHIIAPYLLNFDHIPNIRDENEGSGFTHFDITKFSVPSKTIDDYKNNQFILNAIRIKIQLFEGQKLQYLDFQKEIDTIIASIDSQLK
tara:strand:+ start:387 stop:1148 length:762 start_codon:yes stop_codon:yes gene_type:complete